MITTCPWCGTDCAGIDDGLFRGEHLDWLWHQLATTADRRGDPELVTGTATVTAPTSATARAAATGLLHGRAPRSGQTIRVDLDALTAQLWTHDERLTPGMLAAHVTGRALGTRVRDNARRRDTVERLRDHMTRAFAATDIDITAVWPVLKRTGWVARLVASEKSAQIADHAAAVIARLPTGGARIDRRRLADTVTRFPHALDTGTLPGLVLAVLVASESVPAGLAPRAAWAAVGVDCDDLTGGLLALGIHPDGWTLPNGAVVTLPPRELARCAWPKPPFRGAPVFVTENPSVVTAAADLLATAGRARQFRLLCTVGTPSAAEINAVARLAGTGWQVHVRADFDRAGLQHVAALLDGIPSARPWRMTAADYRESLAEIPADDRIRLQTEPLPQTPWDPDLRRLMVEQQVAAYEESLIDVLLTDLTAESP
ncbi:DUF2399 domain-containing protein [Micromonospora antibiotica]|uniref:DUF2399 domain-containing protein n=1 Tax=Micromonospora antibiotica TaxID=2807623 RepID=A0ABS3V6K5_9ACTN|nr:DUF2399 domain-containing protein [Micromonospora antibiotica]MBO4161221.1 DUF2399 domain-containing protein [Micromonospora antibiotica]